MQHPNRHHFNGTIIWARKMIHNSQHWVIIDTETTGLGKSDEVIQIGILDPHGNVLMDTLIKPKMKKIPPEASVIHGITFEKLQDAPTFDDVAHELIKVVNGRLPVIYNAEYDIRLLHQTAKKYGRSFKAPSECAMKMYSAFKGEWMPSKLDYKWQKLPGGDHSAIGDCKATLAIIQMMANTNTIKPWWQFW